MRYYCHHCHAQINDVELLPDYTCPCCQSGFIEELPADFPRRNSSVDGASRGGSDDGFATTRMFSEDYSDDNSDVELAEQVSGQLAQVFNLFQPTQQQSQTSATNTAGQSSRNRTDQSSEPNQASDSEQPESNRAPTTGRVTRSSANRNAPMNASLDHSLFGDSQTLAEVLNEFITGVSFTSHYPEGTSSGSHNASQGSSASGHVPLARSLINIDFPFLHSNPGDYAWGNAGFDAVITQLLNNLDGSNSGPPPMSQGQIESLPTVTIGDDQVKNSNLQCTVCMDDFQVGDTARQLPCEHFFHQECIIPWLKLHASCPICRKTFASGTAAFQNQNQEFARQSNTQSATGSTDTRQAGSDQIADRGSSSTRDAPHYYLREEDCD